MPFCLTGKPHKAAQMASRVVILRSRRDWTGAKMRYSGGDRKLSKECALAVDAYDSFLTALRAWLQPQAAVMARSRSPSIDAIDLADLSYSGMSDHEHQVHPRQPFRRQSSTIHEPRYATADSKDKAYPEDHIRGKEHTNLGLAITEDYDGSEKLRRVPVGSKDPTTPSGTYTSPRDGSGTVNQAAAHQSTSHGSKKNQWSLSDDIWQSSQSLEQGWFSNYSDRRLLGASPFPNGNAESPTVHCPTNRDILTTPWSWLGISVLLLSVYSTAFSAIFLGIATARPRWGERIGTDRHVSYSTATLLSALFSKTIELSFVTVIVAFLGQILSRRAFRKRRWDGGISIAEMSMRTWIMQPGTLLTHWQAVRYTAKSVLGAVALIAAIAATFYTTAAEALVSPKLRFGPVESRVMGGQVATIFGNTMYLQENCPTPISVNTDPNYRGSTCLEIEHAAKGYQNFNSYMGTWAEDVATGNTSATQYSWRPKPIANMFDNTTVQGQWIKSENTSFHSLKYKRFIQNITMAMPHANVFHAARDPANGIIQPQDLEGNGEYTIFASVPAPSLNILCVGMSEHELAPLIYETWPHAEPLNVSTWETTPPANIPSYSVYSGPYPNVTVVDDLFDFGYDSGKSRQVAPIFPKFPLPYNTIANGTISQPANAVYVIAAPPATYDKPDYLLCAIRAMQYSNCTTKYHVALSGGQLSVHCDDDLENTIPYLKSQPLAPLSAPAGWDENWKDVGTDWINSLGLGGGLSDSMDSLARDLTEMVPAVKPITYATILDPSMPSIGEALGVLAGCTLLLSSEHSPFIHYWNYSYDNFVLDVPQYQYFNASLHYQDYASGGAQSWQGIFYVVLAAVFILNAVCLVYLFWSFYNAGHITDYTIPQNMFALAVNSPPSNVLSGACGAGPEGDVLSRKWQVDMQRDLPGSNGHPHFYIKCSDEDVFRSPRKPGRKKKRSSVGMVEYHRIVESPAVEQFMTLAR